MDSNARSRGLEKTDLLVVIVSAVNATTNVITIMKMGWQYSILLKADSFMVPAIKIKVALRH